MNVEYLIQLLNNKLIVLRNGKIQSFNSGDLPTINAIDEEILGVEDTLNKLKLLLSIDNAAISSNTTTTNVVASVIDAVSNTSQSPTVQGPSAGAVINGYDISAYATDPSYEQKIQNIISGMPLLTIASDIDTYIQGINQGSPITGEMVINAANKYIIDIPLLVAIMQNDSSFGTAGVGARTFNPGNVGNTGTEERSYQSWEEGVMAVAEWLNNHRSA